MAYHFHDAEPSVKIEHDEHDRPFIMELSQLPPISPASSPDLLPTEVPLRATQASKEMRKMMGVFRLNPFAMHTLSRGPDTDDSPDPSPTPASATWSPDAGPLDQEPVMFEFQLDISGLDRGEHDAPGFQPSETSSRLPAISAHDESQLRPFSPSFELHEQDLPEEYPSSYIIQHDASHQKDPGTSTTDFTLWEEADYAPRNGSDCGTSSSTTVSVQTPLNESGSGSPFDNPNLNHFNQDQLPGCPPEHTPTSPESLDFHSAPVWDDTNYHLQSDLPQLSYRHSQISPRATIVHTGSSHSFSPAYPTPSYARRPYISQFQQAQNTHESYATTNYASSLRQGSSPSQEIENIPQSPGNNNMPPLSPVTPNGFQYSHQQHHGHGHYHSQQASPSHHHQIPVYAVSTPVTPTSMPLRLPISIARSAMRSVAAFSNAASPTSCHSQLPSPSHYGVPSNSGMGYRVSRHHQLEDRISENEVYSTPHSPVNEDNREAYVSPGTTNVVTMSGISATMHPILQRSSTYTGSSGHAVPQIVTVAEGGSASPVHHHTHLNTGNRRWSLPEMSVGAHHHHHATVVGHRELYLGHHM